MQWPNLLLLNLAIFFLFMAQKAQALATKRALNSSITALYVFGDSTADPGNNDYIPTAFRSDFPPYGRDLANHKPTGRFSNGKLSTDFIASYAGLKDYVPPYLDPTLSIEELISGFSIASAGSGYDPLTPQISNVIGLSKQLEYFREYKKKLETKMGKKSAASHINKAAFLVSAGTNDFVINYFILQVRRSSYSVSGYQQFIIQHVKQFIQGLWDEGARRIAVVGLPPMGCLPIVTTLLSDEVSLQHSCIEKYSSVGREYNRMLQLELSSLQSRLESLGSKIYYIDIFNSVTNMIQRKQQYGFEKVSSGCCGTGYLEAGPLCNPKSYVCPDASKYVFWDSIHPTERAYYNVFIAARPVIDMIIKD